jgi:hypothetical protein
MKIEVRETEPEKQIRIEALRAAALVVAPILAEVMYGHVMNGTIWENADDQVETSVLTLAKTFANWIETGKR